MRPPLALHVTLRLRDDRVVAPSVALRRALVRRITGVCGAALLAFYVTDTHVHLLLLGTREEAAELARRIEVGASLQMRGGPGFERARITDVVDQAHLRRAFDYILRQGTRHGLVADREQEGSVVQDLLGARVIATAIAGRVRERLPRLTRGDLLAHLGVSELEPALSADGLAAAAAAAFALPSLDGNAPDAVAARRAAVHAGASLGSATLADSLGIARRSVQHLLTAPPPPLHARAVGLQVRLRLSVARAEPYVEDPVNLPSR